MDHIDDILTEQDAPHYTALRPILWGLCKLSLGTIPFCQSILSLDEVFKELQRVEKIPADFPLKWRLEELFQREIDSGRVDDEIVNGYLRRPEKLKFFNSLTVALLPLDARRMLAKSYGDTLQEPELKEALTKQPWQVNNIGGVQVVINSNTPNGYIRWDPKRIFAATIDGQHRLAALRRQYMDGNLSASALDTKISVLFLVLDSRVGFEIEKMHPAGDDNPILTVVREIFIDLNKHAVEVERARRILLDDQDIESRCLRELMATRVGEEQAGRLPVGIVHWQHSVSAKFNIGKRTGPFVTTVELLYSILTDLFDLKRPKDPLDEGQVRRFVASIEEALDVSTVVASSPGKYAGMKSLTTYVERWHLVPEREVPFVNLPSNYLQASVDGFNAHLRPLIVGVLTRFKPYHNFIAEVRKRGGIDRDMAFYLVQPYKAQEQQRREWGATETAKRIEEPLEELAAMKTQDWPFFAVFQKGLLRASAIAWRHFSVVRKGKGTSVEDFLEEWVAYLDELSGRGLLTVKASFPRKERERVWVGISLKSGAETVRWSESAVQRIAATLVLWWYFYINNKSKVGSFLKKIQGSKGNEEFPKAKELVGAVAKGLRSAVVRGDEDPAPSEEEIAERVQKRLRDLILLAMNKTAPADDGVEEEDTEYGGDILMEAQTDTGDEASGEATEEDQG